MPATAESARAAFGVAFELDGIEIPALASGVRDPAAADPPTRVRLADASEVERRWSGAASERVRELRGADGTLLLSVDTAPDLGYLLRTPFDGAFHVGADALEVACAPLPAAGPAWTHVLVGQVLPLVATLRGLEPLHASAVELGGRALVFTAPSGVGKTSLALHLVLAGARLLADDVVALEAADALSAHPGAGALRVRAAETARLDAGERERLGPARVEGGKAVHDVAPAGGPVPVGAVLALRRVATAEGELLRRLDPVDPLLLLGSTFNLSVRTPERLERQLDVCARLAREVPVVAVDVPPGVDAAALAHRVAAWAASGVPA